MRGWQRADDDSERVVSLPRTFQPPQNLHRLLVCARACSRSFHLALSLCVSHTRSSLNTNKVPLTYCQLSKVNLSRINFRHKRFQPHAPSVNVDDSTTTLGRRILSSYRSSDGSAGGGDYISFSRFAVRVASLAGRFVISENRDPFRWTGHFCGSLLTIIYAKKKFIFVKINFIITE